MAKNEYARKLQAKKAAERQMFSEIIWRWMAQMCLDVMTIVLNDPEVMGKDRFGSQRLNKLNKAFNKEFNQWIVGLSPDVTASYVREKMDERLRKICGDEFLKWEERYFCWDDKGI